jgi:hypothetical protein
MPQTRTPPTRQESPSGFNRLSSSTREEICKSLTDVAPEEMRHRQRGTPALSQRCRASFQGRSRAEQGAEAITASTGRGGTAIPISRRSRSQ